MNSSLKIYFLFFFKKYIHNEKDRLKIDSKNNNNDVSEINDEN